MSSIVRKPFAVTEQISAIRRKNRSIQVKLTLSFPKENRMSEKKYVSIEEFTGEPIKNEDLIDLLADALVPADIKVNKGVYQDNLCAQVIYPNLDPEIQEKISLEILEDILAIQGEFVETTENEEILDEENLEYLVKKCEEKNIPATIDDLEEIFDAELIYLYLIDVLG
jgi:hypothetical protein